MYFFFNFDNLHFKNTDYSGAKLCSKKNPASLQSLTTCSMITFLFSFHIVNTSVVIAFIIGNNTIITVIIIV